MTGLLPQELIGLFVRVAKAIAWLYPIPVAVIYQLIAMPIIVLSLFDVSPSLPKLRRVSRMFFRLAATGIVIGFFSAVTQSIYVLFHNPPLLFVILKMRILAPVWFTIGLLFFCLKRFKPIAYGSFELLVGASSIIFAISKYSEDVQAEVISLLGGIYIIVRGCDNIDRGLKPEWKTSVADFIARNLYLSNENFLP